MATRCFAAETESFKAGVTKMQHSLWRRGQHLPLGAGEGNPLSADSYFCFCTFTPSWPGVCDGPAEGLAAVVGSFLFVSVAGSFLFSEVSFLLGASALPVSWPPLSVALDVTCMAGVG